MEVEIPLTQPERLYSVLTSGGPDPIWLLGAGASVRSGIPLSSELVERVARWAFCRDHGWVSGDPSVRRSDWFPWLEKRTWYRRDISPAENYHAVVERLLQPREDRKQFFLDLIRPGIPPSSGYERMADLMASYLVRTILTTNFDRVLPDLCSQRKTLHHVEIIRTPDDYTKISTQPRHPQIVYLHGSVEHYTDKNLLEEVERLDGALVDRLVPMLRDHPLIVVGYRGTEPSVMHHLLLSHASSISHFRHGVFWCAFGARGGEALHPLVRNFAATIGQNFQLIPIAGFDELIGDLWDRGESGRRVGRMVTPARPEESETLEAVDLPFDMQRLEGARSDGLDWRRVRDVAIEYCNRMGLPLPPRIDEEWLTGWLCDRDLARRMDGRIELTVGAVLLFGTRPQDHLQCARVRITSEGEQDSVAEGHLWAQLDRLSRMFDELNPPFIEKGMPSRKLHLYSPLALKEILVNALVHRRYDVKPSDVALIDIRKNEISVTNPGGLVEEVLRALRRKGTNADPTTSEILKEELERGQRGLRGYRNPLIADIFYGGGAMEKAGSGLADVFRWMRENGGRVDIMVSPDNATFRIVVQGTGHPDESGTVSSTARPIERFTTNLLEVMGLPQTIWHGPTEARLPRELLARMAGISPPPFVLYERRLYTFSDLQAYDNPLRAHVDAGGIEALTLEEFAEDSDGERRLVWLLNEGMYRHLEALGLTVDKRRKRAYFPRSELGVQEVTYRGRLRRATRTVTKPVVSRTTGQVRFWQHEAMQFAFAKFGETWALQIVPTYVFTRDGMRTLLEGRRFGPMATRRASRDYNPHVESDLYFWVAVLSNEHEQFAVELGFGAGALVRADLAGVDAPGMEAYARFEPIEVEGIEGVDNWVEVEDEAEAEGVENGSDT